MKSLRHIGSNMVRSARQFMAVQAGFTLIELLVVVIILGLLAAVVVPNVARFAGRGQTEARKTEEDNVQLAIDAYMTENRLATIAFPATGPATSVDDFGSTLPADLVQIDLDAGAGTAYLYPDWLRQQKAMDGVSYCWTSTGTVTQKPYDGGGACP